MKESDIKHVEKVRAPQATIQVTTSPFEPEKNPEKLPLHQRYRTSYNYILSP